MAKPPDNPTCPRCGYDQSGAVALWTDQCPTHGRCPECGTDFAWADLFNPARKDLRWLVEHTGNPLRQVARTGPTLARMALPWVFWARVDVGKRASPPNLLVWLLVLAAGSHLLAWVPVSLGLMLVWYGVRVREISTVIGQYGWNAIQGPAATGLLWPVAYFERGVPRMGSPFTEYLGDRLLMWTLPLGYGLVWFVILGCLPVTRRIAKVRIAHVARGLLLCGGVLILCLQLTRVLYLFESAHVGAGYAVFFLFYAVCLWTVLWWACAVWKGWAIRSILLMVLGTIAGLLGGLTLFTLGTLAT
jgi:hypothetical protein